MTRAAAPRRGRRRRGDNGLATLEWLLIVAAVAGLAALAVVLVQAYVEDTGQRISDPNPRMLAAMLAADEVTSDAARDADEQPAWAKTYGPWSEHYTSECEQLGILYEDAEIKMEPNFNLDPGGNPPVRLVDEVDADNIETYLANDDQARDIMVVGGAIAHCRVTQR